MIRYRLISYALRLLVGAVLGITSLGQISLGTALADGFDVVGHLGGAPNVLVPHAGYLYLGLGPELAVFDVAGATPDIRIGYIVFPDVVQDIALTSDGTYAGVAARAAGFWLVDLTQPTTPRAVALIDTPALDVAIAGDYAYVVGDTGLQIVEMAEPKNPSAAGALETPGRASRVTVYGDHAYIALPWFAMDVAAPGAFARVAARSGGLCVVDLHPRVSILAGVLPPPDEFWSVAVTEGYAYLGDRTFGLRMVDVTDPIAPRETGFVDPTGSGGIEDIVVTYNTVYAAIGYDGLRAMDVSDPASPIEVGAFDTPGAASGMAVGWGVI